MKYIRNRFIAGLLFLLPAVVTGWIIWKIFSTVDNILEPVQQRFPIIDFPGVGFAVVLLLILFTGIFASNLIGHRIIALGERILYRLPIIRRIYVAVKELSGVFLADRKVVFKDVVVIRYPHRDSYALGFVTQEATTRFSDIVGRPLLNVFVPTTPNPTSGFLIFIPADEVLPVPIDVEEGLKMVISGGVFVPPSLDGTTSRDVTGR
jgi:uncharacterized membrane protein